MNEKTKFFILLALLAASLALLFYLNGQFSQTLIR